MLRANLVASKANVAGEGEDLLLPCAICSQDLNHELYQIMEHPILPVATCVLCYEDLKKVYKSDWWTDRSWDDRCHWCLRDDCGTLNICEDGKTCRHQFCEDCLLTNFGQNYLDAVRSEDMWRCLKCNPPNELRELTKAMFKAQHESIYYTWIPEGDHPSKEDFADYYTALLGEIVTTRDSQLAEFDTMVDDRRRDSVVNLVFEEILDASTTNAAPW